MRKFVYVFLLFFLGFFLLFVDFSSKAYVNSRLLFVNDAEGVAFHEASLFTGLLSGIDFSITLAFNRGMALSLFENFSWLILVLRIVVILTLFVYLFFYRQSVSFDLPFVLIITGALGNVVDYFLYGSVVDFFHFRFWGYSFPIFNVADALITIGVFWLFFLNLFKKISFFPTREK